MDDDSKDTWAKSEQAGAFIYWTYNLVRVREWQWVKLILVTEVYKEITVFLEDLHRFNKISPVSLDTGGLVIWGDARHEV